MKGLVYIHLIKLKFLSKHEIFYIQIRTYIIGLGAGLLPMFLHACLPFLQIEVGTS